MPAGLALATSAGCSTFASPSVSPVALPPLPTCAQPVEVAAPAVGEPLLLIAARERAGRLEANRNVACVWSWYQALREGFAE
jgi:hypothetical protein